MGPLLKESKVAFSFITHIDMTKSKLSQKYPTSSSPLSIDENVYIWRSGPPEF